MAEDRPKSTHRGNGPRRRRLDGRTEKPSRDELTIEDLEESAYRELLISLTWMATFDITVSNGRLVDPYKKQRMQFGRLIKDYGFEGTMQIMTTRSESNKMLLSLLGKKKIAKKGGAFSEAKYIEALYKKLAAVENLTAARRVIQAEMEAGVITDKEAQYILEDVTEQLSDTGPQRVPVKEEHDPLAALMEDGIEEAELMVEEDGEDDGSIQESEADNAF